MTQKRIRFIAAALCIAFAVLSVTYLAEKYSSPETYAKSIEYLDTKNTEVMELAGAAAVVSVIASAIPGDTATPIANKLADLTSYFLLILCAVFLEKYLLTVMGGAVFYVVIPLSMLLLVIWLLSKKNLFVKASLRILAFGLSIVLLVPTSVWVSEKIENTYHEARGISVIEQEDLESDEIEEEIADESKTFWQKLKDLPQKASETVQKKTTELKENITEQVAEVEQYLSDFIEQIAIMIVTSCLIPAFVLFSFVWLSKQLLGLNIPVAATVIRTEKTSERHKENETISERS